MASGTRKRRREEAENDPAEGSSQALIPAAAPITAQEIFTSMRQVSGFNSIQEFHTHLNALQTPEEQYDAVQALAETWHEFSSSIDQVAEILDDTATHYNLRNLCKKNNAEFWSELEKRADNARATRDEKSQAQAYVYRILGKENVKRDFAGIEHLAAHTWKSFRNAVTAFQSHEDVSYETFVRSVLQAQLHRLTRGTKGVKVSQLHPTAVDFTTSKKLLSNGEVKSAKELRRAVNGAGFGVMTTGLLCTAEDALAIQAIPEHEDSSSSLSEPPEGEDEDVPGRIVDVTELDEDLISQLGVAKSNVDGDAEDLPTDDEEVVDFDEEYEGAYREVSSSVEREASPVDDDTFMQDDDDTDVASEDPVPQRASTHKKKASSHTCGCAGDIPIGFISQLKKGFRPDAIAQALLIRNWNKHCLDSEGNQAIDRICYRHTIWVFSALGMKSKGKNHDKLGEILNQYHYAALRHKIGEFKTDNDTYIYFRKSHRPERANDSLGVYKYRFDQLATALEFNAIDQQALREGLGVDFVKWSEIGSLNINGMSWWKDEGLAHEGLTIYDVATAEFEMYDHHLRMIDGKANYGWLRTMYHGLVQQVMRQDPWYWMLYCSLRDDRNHNLVSYPYYAKYQHPGDSTFFRHIDINLPQLLEFGQGMNQIQGTVSLDDEAVDDCTEILPGMHLHTDEWTRDLLGREGVKLGAAVHVVGVKEFNNDDKKKYSTDWTAVPCKALEVRITDPRLPHGAQGPAKIVRRTLLPWFVSLQAGLYHLEISEAGTWDDLAKAHRDLAHGPRSPSGLPNRHGKIPYAFPAAVPLTGLGPISDALVCRIRHDAVPVTRLKQKLLLSTQDVRTEYLKEWRVKATIAVVNAWKEVVAAEKEIFAEKSYFARLDQGDDAVVLDADVDNSPQRLTRGGHGQEVDEAKQFTAEHDGPLSPDNTSASSSSSSTDEE